MLRLALIAAVLTACSATAVAETTADLAPTVTQPAPLFEGPGTTAKLTKPTRETPTTTPVICPTPHEPAAENVWTDAGTLALEHRGWDGLEVSISVWVQGVGEVLFLNPNLHLFPASNQKIVTAVGALDLLKPEFEFHTSVEERGDELILRAGGDPTLLTSGAHSLEFLASQVADAAGKNFTRLVIDAGHFEPNVSVAGRLDWQLPTYTGPLSAFIVDDNRWTTDEVFLANPALVNGQRFADVLRRNGVAVGEVVHIDHYAPIGNDVASADSEPTGTLVAKMMKSSDNEIAESLLREIGAGSTAAGASEIDTALAQLCLTGATGDGSGLSRANLRPARDLREILQFALTQEWGEEFYQSFPIAGVSGTMANRLAGSPTYGDVRAKTGTIIGGRALSGFATTADGRQMIFSVITNGEPDAAAASTAAIDALIIALVAARP